LLNLAHINAFFFLSQKLVWEITEYLVHPLRYHSRPPMGCSLQCRPPVEDPWFMIFWALEISLTHAYFSTWHHNGFDVNNNKLW